MPLPNFTLRGLVDLSNRRQNPLKPGLPENRKCKHGKHMRPVLVGNDLDGRVMTYECTCKELDQ